MSEHSGLNKRYEVYDRMSTESLNALLDLEAQLDGSGELDPGTIAYIAGVIARRELEARTQTLPDLKAAWDSFQKNYLPNPAIGASLYNFDEEDAEFAADLMVGILPDGRRIDLCAALEPHPVSPPQKRRKPLAIVGRVAAILAMVLLVGTVSAYALGGTIRQAVGHWFQDVFFFDKDSITDTGGELTKSTNSPDSYASLQDALTDYKISTHLAPTWIPEGYALNYVKVDETSSRVNFLATYQSKTSNDEITVYISKVSDPSKLKTFEKDGRDVTIYETHGIQHYIMGNLEKINAAWVNSNYECSISGRISNDVIVKIINSIY